MHNPNLCFHPELLFLQMNSATGGLLNDDEGSCSDSALELLCTKVKIYEDTFAAFQELRGKEGVTLGGSSCCTWVDEKFASGVPESALEYMKSHC